ncbi:cytosolic sulfotransferase 2 [Nematolebias whitei]|uniref:cytosolic sulfotransferase 2 n=1 Tax=Nematolebias whitei TaxID=451745 RepID=UPI0018976AA1|nr:cytosolic sulfotransferase 2 [Nematolebias whitei]
MESPPRPTLFDFHGVSMTRFFTDNWENVQKLKARPDDVVLASYPKAGNTWVSYILDLLYCDETTLEQQDSVPLFDKVPFLELYHPGFPSGVDATNHMTKFPRIIKTHLPVQFLPQSFWEQNAKIVYVARNAKDSAVSYFHFDRMNKAQPEPGDWSSFLHRFMEGQMVFGSWYEHVTGWWEKKQTSSNILFLFYEDLIEDFAGELNRLCSFLGLSPSAEKKKHITEKVLFDNMKRNKMVNGSTDEVFDLSISHFIRKGNVGDWKNHFTVKQDEEFTEDYKRKMKTTDLCFRTVL